MEDTQRFREKLAATCALYKHGNRTRFDHLGADSNE